MMWSSHNELTDGGGGAFDYDALGRLVYGTTSATRFDYDGSAMIAEYSSAGTLLRRYVFGPGTDEPIVWYEGSGTGDKRYMDQDERGSVTRITQADGSTLAIDSYDEYGIPASTNQGRFQYTGQIWLPEIGMYDYKARMYSPTLGRFLQTDPIGYGDGPNWYNYAHGNPVNGTDPFGLDEIVVTAKKQDEVNPDGNSGGPVSTGGLPSGIGGGVSAPFGGGRSITPQNPEIVVTARRHRSIFAIIASAAKSLYCSLVPHPSGVQMVSAWGGITAPFIPKSISISIGLGAAIDPQSNLSVPAFGFAGRGIGSSEAFTANYTMSNAQNFSQFGGAFGEAGGVAGAGLGGGYARFGGPGGVSGTTYSAGEVTGASVAAGASYTSIGPSINLDQLGGC